MNPPKLFQDKYYLRCISLAMKSRGEDERYGSIVVQDNKIIGEGFNRAIAHYCFKEKLERKIRQGYANHAEIEAMDMAVQKGFDINRSDLYVAGYFPKSNQLFFKESYTCVRCIPYMRNYGIVNVYDPMPNNWLKKPLELAAEEAKKFTNGTHRKRLNARVGKFFINQLDLSN